MTKATAGGFALVLEPTPNTKLKLLNRETKMALDFKCVFGNWVDRGSTRVNDWPKRHCKLASILPVFTGFQSLTPLLRKVRSFHLPGFSVMAAWRCWCASRLARLLANISGACCVRRLWWQQRLSARREPCDLCDFGRCRLWPAGGGGARGTAGHSGVCWQCSAVACLWVRRGGGGIWDSPSYPFRRHPSVVRRSPFFAVRRRRRSPSSLGERGIGGGGGGGSWLVRSLGSPPCRCLFSPHRQR